MSDCSTFGVRSEKWKDLVLVLLLVMFAGISTSYTVEINSVSGSDPIESPELQIGKQNTTGNFTYNVTVDGQDKYEILNLDVSNVEDAGSNISIGEESDVNSGLPDEVNVTDVEDKSDSSGIIEINTTDRNQNGSSHTITLNFKQIRFNNSAVNEERNIETTLSSPSSDASGKLNFIYEDTIKPNASILDIANDSTSFVSGESVKINYTLTDLGSFDQNRSFLRFNNSALSGEIARNERIDTGPLNSEILSIDENVEEGDYDVHLNGTDNAGNTNNSIFYPLNVENNVTFLETGSTEQDTSAVSNGSTSIDVYYTVDSTADPLQFQLEDSEGDLEQFEISNPSDGEKNHYQIDLSNYNSIDSVGEATLRAENGDSFTSAENTTKFDIETTPPDIEASKIDLDTIELNISDNFDMSEASVEQADFELSPGSIGDFQKQESENNTIIRINLTDEIDSETLDVGIASGRSVEDRAGNQLTDDYPVRTVDEMDGVPPSISGSTLEDETDGNALVTDGHVVEAYSIVTDNGAGVSKVTANFSDFGGPESKELESEKSANFDWDGDNTLEDDVYGANITVDNSSSTEGAGKSVDISAVDSASATNTQEIKGVGNIEADYTIPEISKIKVRDDGEADSSPIGEGDTTDDFEATEDNGEIDLLILEFTDDVDLESFDTSDFTVEGYTLDMITEGKTDDDASVQIELHESDNLDTGATPNVTYTRGNLADEAGNKVPEFEVNTEDDAEPIAHEGYALDKDSDGDIESVNITFSEDIKDSASDLDASSYTASSTSVRSVSTGHKVNDNTINLELDPIDNTSAKPDILADSSNVNLEDDQGNNLTLTESEQLISTSDVAQPLIEKAYTEDTTDSGDVDKLYINFTEPITSSSNLVDKSNLSLTDGSITGLNTSYGDDQIKLNVSGIGNKFVPTELKAADDDGRDLVFKDEASLSTEYEEGRIMARVNLDFDSCTKITKPGEYNLESDINVDTTDNCLEINSSDVHLYGNDNSVIGNTSSGTAAVYVDGSGSYISNISIEDIRLKNWTDGFIAHQVKDSLLDNITSEGISGAVGASGIVLKSTTENITVSDSIVKDSDRGVEFTGTDLEVRDTRIESTDEYGLYFNGEQNKADNVYLESVGSGGGRPGVYFNAKNAVLNNSVVNSTGEDAVSVSAAKAQILNTEIYDSGTSSSGISVDQDGDNLSIENTLIKGSGKDGILLRGEDVDLIDTRINNSGENGIKIHKSARNSYIENSKVLNSEDTGIYFVEGAGDSFLSSTELSGNYDASDKDYSIAQVPGSGMNSTNVTGENINLSGQIIDFEGRDVSFGIGNPEIDNPSNKDRVSAYLDAENNSDSGSWMYMNFSYSQSAVEGKFNESDISIWYHNSTDWNKISGTSGLNENENYAYANATEFSSFASFAEPVPNVKAEGQGNFGEVEEGNSETKVFNITNTGRENLTINSIQITGDTDQFSITGSKNGSISSETNITTTGYWSVEVEFNPTSTNSYDADLEIKSNDPDESTEEVALDGDGAPSSSSSSGGGGGSTDFGTSTSSVTESQTFLGVKAGQENEIDVENPEQLGVNKVDLSLNTEKDSLEVTVDRQASEPEDTESPPGESYKYVEINADVEDSEVEKASIDFSVNKSWINENEIDPDTITMRRYNGGWDELETVKTGEEENKFNFEAQTPGFSYFSITGEKAEEKDESTQEGNQDRSTENITENDPDLENQTKDEGTDNSSLIDKDPNQTQGSPDNNEETSQSSRPLISIFLVLLFITMLILYIKREYISEKVKEIEDKQTEKAETRN